jgi:hypothetical protein
MPFRLSDLSEFHKKVLLAAGAILLGLAVIEAGLWMSGVSFDRREPPAWL